MAAHQLLKRERSLMVAVSGGMDSMVLLHVLQQLSPKYSWKLTVAHFNHQLRGNSSNADQRLVVRSVKALGLRVVTGSADVKGLARRDKISIEMAARIARHEFLAREAKRRRIPAVALAHHADDQLELFFLRLFRGSSYEALSGMKWENRSPRDSGIQLIRPLLGVPKAALKEYAIDQNISFREDATNALLDFQRNRIRNELLPFLRRNYQPALDRVIARVMDVAGSEADFVSAKAAEWLASQNKTSFANLPVAIQRRCLQQQLWDACISADFELIDQLQRNVNRAVSAGPDLCVRRDPGGRLEFRRSERAKVIGDLQEVKLDQGTSELVFGGVKFRWRLSARKNKSLPKREPLREVFDADKVGVSIILRHWRPGDRFQPIGMRSAVKLQNLFTNQKIPRSDRHQLVVATTSTGELFWVEKLRVSEQFKVSMGTNRRLQWNWKRL
jgi:tRNA(Ile)-lysidine synthase